MPDSHPKIWQSFYIFQICFYALLSLSLWRYPTPVWDEISKTIPTPISTQSKPLIPGLRCQAIRKKIMVKGAKSAKRRGQIQALNAELNRPGLISHHTNIAKRGPKSIKIVVAQHIFFAFPNINLFGVVFLPTQYGRNNHYAYF
jgi:hypothetical protein